MITIGDYNSLKPLRNTSVGVFLGDEDGTEILLPNKYVPKGLDFDTELQVFCYLDHQERPIATTLTPKIKRGEFALLQVVDTNAVGAFLDWGLEKQLFVPFKEQNVAMNTGEKHLVYCYLDEITFRLAASARLNKFLQKNDVAYEPNQRVDLMAWRKTPIGWEVIIDRKHKGLIFSDHVFTSIKTGDDLTGYIKAVRPDGKIDVLLQPMGVKALDAVSQVIWDAVEENDGFLALHDRSDPETIKKMLGISKKAFKKGVGVLYKERRILLEENGIRRIDLNFD